MPCTQSSHVLFECECQRCQPNNTLNCNLQLFLILSDLLLPQKKLWPGHGAGVVPKKRHRNRAKARWERQRIVVLGNKAAVICSKRFENREIWSFYMLLKNMGKVIESFCDNLFARQCAENSGKRPSTLVTWAMGRSWQWIQPGEQKRHQSSFMARGLTWNRQKI